LPDDSKDFFFSHDIEYVIQISIKETFNNYSFRNEVDSPFSDEESAYFKTLAAITPSVKLRIPLQLAMLVSPVYLLMNTQLHKTDIDKHMLLCLAKAYGNRKPPLLLQVEKIIFSCLLKLARGEFTVVQALHFIVKDVPWDDITSASENDRAWFKGGKFFFYRFFFIYL